MEWEALYDIMKREFEQQSGETMADDGDLGIRMKVVAGEMVNLYNQLDFCEKQMFPQTATGTYLDKHAQTRDLFRKHADSAVGMITFSRSTAAAQDIVIPLGTVCTSSAGNNVMYATTEEGVIPAGSKSVSLAAKASTKGRISNIAAGKIDTLVSAVSGVEQVTNAESFAGGREEEEDESLRKRLLDSYLNVSNGANLKFYEDFALAYPQVWSAKAAFSETAQNQLNLVVSDIFRTTPQSLCEEIQEAIQEARELNIKVNVQQAEVVNQAVSVKIFLRELQSVVSQNGLARNFLGDAVLKLGIGESLNPYTIANGIEEVLDGFQGLEFLNPTGVVKVNENQILNPGQITVTFERG